MAQKFLDLTGLRTLWEKAVAKFALKSHTHDYAPSSHTHKTGTVSEAGFSKLYETTGSNTDGAMTQSAVTSALTNKLDKTGTANRATSDANGNAISSTYIKNISVSGDTLTYTKGNNTTGSVKVPKGEKGEAGAPGVKGDAGPNTITSSTTTTYSGLLKGSGGKIVKAVENVDYALPTHSHTMLNSVSNSATPVNETIETAAHLYRIYLNSPTHSDVTKMWLQFYTQKEAQGWIDLFMKKADGTQQSCRIFTTMDPPRCEEIGALGKNGVAVAAKKLETGRKINVTGDVSGSVYFDGSQNVELALHSENSTTEYTTTPDKVICGKWIDGETIYRVVVQITKEMTALNFTFSKIIRMQNLLSYGFSGAPETYYAANFCPITTTAANLTQDYYRIYIKGTNLISKLGTKMTRKSEYVIIDYIK